MNKQAKGVVTFLCVAAIVGAVFHFATRTKKRYAKAIIKANGTAASLAELMTRDEGYLRSWAKAISKGKSTFSYNSENYNSTGGKKIV